MIRWGVALTLAGPVEQVRAYVAHYGQLGAQRIWLHFDDPDDPAAEALSGVKGVQVIRCDAAYWQDVCGSRPATHQERQVKNITRLTRRAKLDWIGHFDLDEFLIADRPVAEILAEVVPDQWVLRVEPFEALHDPDLPPDIFTGQVFRGQVADSGDLYGPYGALLERGMLSHTVGKCFFRTGQRQMVARIHGARIAGQSVPGGAFHPDLALLHFHAQDRTAWLDRLAFRLERGAYQYRPEMRAWLMQAEAGQIADFYDQVQRARPALIAALAAQGRIRHHALNLQQKVARRFGDV